MWKKSHVFLLNTNTFRFYNNGVVSTVHWRATKVNSSPLRCCCLPIASAAEPISRCHNSWRGLDTFQWWVVNLETHSFILRSKNNTFAIALYFFTEWSSQMDLSYCETAITLRVILQHRNSRWLPLESIRTPCNTNSFGPHAHLSSVYESGYLLIPRTLQSGHLDAKMSTVKALNHCICITQIV